jgi:hypothetical protein
MKTKSILATSIMGFISLSCFSQKDSSGVYFTANDFVSHKLCFAINCKKQKLNIKSDLIFYPNKITIKHENAIYTYPKDSNYGIKYSDGAIIRIYKNLEYRLLKPNETILIYEVISTIQVKGSPPATKCYFSKDAKSLIEKLTM